MDPRPYNQNLVARVLGGGAITVASAYLYTVYLHRSLARQIVHREIPPESRKAAYEAGELESLPTSLIESPANYRVIHERDEKTFAPVSLLENDNIEDLFTRLLRRNMSCFSRTPQGWMLWLIARTTEQQRSFTRSHILSINYQEGDLFCGFYRVVKRSPLKMEVGFEPPPGSGSLEGRLVISLSRRGEHAVLSTETLQWTTAPISAMRLPLEHAFLRFLHQTVTWWLLVSGARYIESLDSA